MSGERGEAQLTAPIPPNLGPACRAGNTELGTVPILPERLTGRPDGVLLSVEWPWIIHTLRADSVRLSFQDRVFEAVYTDLVPQSEDTTGPFRLDVTTGAWSVTYEATVEKGILRYRCTTEDEVAVVRARSTHPLSDWLNDNGLVFILDDDRMIEGDLLYKPTWHKDPFDRSQLTPLDWAGTKFKVESQTEKRITHSIQYRAIAELKAELEPWDVIIDDDGTGEIADIVALRIDSEGLLVRLVHCKYSHEEAAGARIDDLYDVCGQAQKSIMWRRSDLRPFFRTLDDCARKKQLRTNVNPFEVGDIKKLFELRDKSMIRPRRMEIFIVQPGLSIKKASTQQLDLLASTQAYLKTTINAPLTVWCSP